MSAAGNILNWQYVALAAIILGVVLLPLVNGKIERNIEAFLFAAGCAAVTVANAWSTDLLTKTIRAPLAIAIVVLVSGLAFFYNRERLDHALARINGRLTSQGTIFLIVVTLGFLASIITAVIASLILIEIVSALKLPRARAVKVVVLSCFSIGLGAALTPTGEPLSTVVVARLDADYFYLFRLLIVYIAPSIILLGIAAAVTFGNGNGKNLCDWEPEKTPAAAFIRAAKVYVFVCALLLLGAGLEQLATRFIAPMPGSVLFWVNIISAALDNATLAAAEVNTSLTSHQLSAALLGLLTSGGILIPGNIPNIVAAGHLHISSREWARIGIPIGLVLMGATFAVWRIFGPYIDAFA